MTHTTNSRSTSNNIEDPAARLVTRRDLDTDLDVLEEKLTSDAAGLGVWIARLEERLVALDGVWDKAAAALERRIEAEREQQQVALRAALAERDAAIARLERRCDELTTRAAAAEFGLRLVNSGLGQQIAEQECAQAALSNRIGELESCNVGATLDQLEADVAGLQRGLRNVADAHP